jgi:hypothetical protein
VLSSSVDQDQKQVRTVFSFNKGNQGWHYAWQSHRKTHATQHELHIFILAGSKHSSFFTCVCELSSPEFDIHCRRKRKASPTDEPGAPLNLMSFVPGGLGLHSQESNGQLSGKRNADQISTTEDNNGRRSVSPERPMLKERVIGMDQIMPSNTVTTSPLSTLRNLGYIPPMGSGLIAPNMAGQISNQPLPMTALSKVMDGQLGVGAGGSNTSASLLLRIQLLEQRKQQLQVLQLQMQHSSGAQFMQPLTGMPPASASLSQVSSAAGLAPAGLPAPLVTPMTNPASLPESMAPMYAMSPAQIAGPPSPGATSPGATGKKAGPTFKAMPSHYTGALPSAETNTKDPLSILALCC